MKMGGFMNKSMIQWGFLLIGLGLLTGFIIPMTQLPRLGLSAHTIALLSGIFLMALGAVWGQFTLTDGQKKWLGLSWLYASYANWFGILLGAFLGAGKMTPLAAKGATGSEGSELAVAVFLGSLSLAALIGTGLAVYGLRSAPQK